MTNPLKSIAIAAIMATAALASAAFAQKSEEKAKEPEQGGIASTVATGKLPYLEQGAIPEDTVKRGAELADQMVRDILKAYEEKQTADDVKAAENVRRRADDIANATIAKERDGILEFLGIDPNASTALYYFVSWSMPLEMLRSYAIEAMWAGGTLVIKGVPPGKELMNFMVEDVKQLVYGKGASANISIDPRLFDVYAVDTVPTMVYTTVRDNLQCQGVNPVKFKAGEMTLSYDTCPELDPSTYWKLSGAVTTNYALQAFKDAGAPGVDVHMKALSRGWAGLDAPGKEQKPYVGDWKDVLSPAEQAAAEEAYKAMQPKASAKPKRAKK